MFWIYENWHAGPHKAVIHRGDCGCCNDGAGRGGGYDPRHAQWHGPFDTLAVAEGASAALFAVVIRVRHRCV